MKAVILCGGEGTRIRDVHESMPKPMLTIGEKPIVWHIMKGYAEFGIKDFVLCLGYKGWLIKQYFLSYKAMLSDVTVDLAEPESCAFHRSDANEDWKVTLAETGRHTMTGGRIAAIRRYVESDDIFLLTYGDGVADIDVPRLIDFHRRQGKIVTVTSVRPPSRFGELSIVDGQVKRFAEKPQTSTGSINGGFFVCDAARIWDYIPAEPSTIFEDAPLRALAQDGQLAAYEHTGFWQPMDTAREYQLLNHLWSTGKAPWKVWDEAA